MIIIISVLLMNDITVGFKRIYNGTTIGLASPGFEWTKENYGADLDVKKEHLFSFYPSLLFIQNNTNSSDRVLTYDARITLFIENPTFKSRYDCKHIDKYGYIFIPQSVLDNMESVEGCGNITTSIKEEQQPYKLLHKHKGYLFYKINQS